MIITGVSVNLMVHPAPSGDPHPLLGFAEIVLDGCFAIHDLKIIEGQHGPFVSMPSRRLMDRCPHCGCKNHLRAKFCNACGQPLSENRVAKDANGREGLFADVAHPITADCRAVLGERVLAAYRARREDVPEAQPSFIRG